MSEAWEGKGEGTDKLPSRKRRNTGIVAVRQGRFLRCNTKKIRLIFFVWAFQAVSLRWVFLGKVYFSLLGH